MTRIDADVEALTAMRQAISLFALRQNEAMALMAREMEQAIYELEETAHYWPREGSVYSDAPQHLARVQQLQQRLQEAYAWHQQQMEHLGTLLNDEAVPDAVRFLVARVDALHAYYAVSAEANQPLIVPDIKARKIEERKVGASEVAASEVPTRELQPCEATLTAVVTACQSQLRDHLGKVGEEIVAQVLSAKLGAQQVTPPRPSGVAHICYFPGVPVFVMDLTDQLAKIAESDAPSGAPSNLMMTVITETTAVVANQETAPQPALAIATNQASAVQNVYGQMANGAWQRIPHEAPKHDEVPKQGPQS